MKTSIWAKTSKEHFLSLGESLMAMKDKGHSEGTPLKNGKHREGGLDGVASSSERRSQLFIPKDALYFLKRGKT